MKSMTLERITVTIDARDLETVRDLVTTGRVGSVSAFVQKAVALALDDEHRFQDELDGVLADSGGPLTSSEATWARAALGLEART